MSGEKRPREAANNGEKRSRVPRLPSVIVEAVQMDYLQKFVSGLEPMLRQVQVGEEIESVLTRISQTGARTYPKQILGPDTRNLQLQFRNKLGRSIFTNSKLEGEQGSPIHIMLIDANTGQPVTTGQEAIAKLDVVVLEGDFDCNDKDDWTSEQFSRHEVKERDGKRPLLVGDLTVTLREGVGTLGDLSFTDNSSWIRSRKFRLGVKIASGFCEGVRIREAKTEAFPVRDQRGEAYKKHYPPASDDEVWRLDNIGKDGAFCKRLNESGIMTVEDFLTSYMVKPHWLKNILGNNMPTRQWEATIEHAKSCVLSGKLYVYYINNPPYSGVVFNNICQLTGVIKSGGYVSIDALQGTQMEWDVDRLVKIAYDHWDDVAEYTGESLIAERPGMDNHSQDPSTSVGYSGFNNQQAISSFQDQQETSHQEVQDWQTSTVELLPFADSVRSTITGRGLVQSNVSVPDMHFGFVNESQQLVASNQQEFVASNQGTFDIGLNARHYDPSNQASTTLPQQNMVSFLDSPNVNIGYASHDQQFISSGFGPSQLSLPQNNLVSGISAARGVSLGNPQHTASSASIDQFVAGPFNLDASEWRYASGQEVPRGSVPAVSYSEEYIRANASKFFEQEDVRQELMLLQSAQGQFPGSLNVYGGDGYSLTGLNLSPAPSPRSGRGNVGWLKIKAAVRWGIFIRRIAADKRRRFLAELEDDTD